MTLAVWLQRYLSRGALETLVMKSFSEEEYIRIYRHKVTGGQTSYREICERVAQSVGPDSILWSKLKAKFDVHLWGTDAERDAFEAQLSGIQERHRPAPVAPTVHLHRERLHRLDHDGDTLLILVTNVVSVKGGDTLVTWLNAAGGARSALVTKGQPPTEWHALEKLGMYERNPPKVYRFLASWIAAGEWGVSCFIV